MKKYIAAILISISILGTLTGCKDNRDIGKDEGPELHWKMQDSQNLTFHAS